MALVTFDDYKCSAISPSVVLDHSLDGADLTWVRDHLRRCEACRERVDRERLRREEQADAAISVAPRRHPGSLTLPRERGRHISGWAKESAASLVVSVRVRTYAQSKPLAQSRRYALVALIALLVAGFFVSSSPRLSAVAVKPSPAFSAPLAAGSVDSTKPSAVPSPSTSPQPSNLPPTSQDGTAATMVAPASHPTPVATPAATHAPTPASTPPVPPSVHLAVTPLSGLAPLIVTADAAGSTSARGIASYQFDFGNGPVSPLLGGTSVAHTYVCAGRYKVKVTVTDTAGLSSSAFVYVDVTLPVNPVSC